MRGHVMWQRTKQSIGLLLAGGLAMSVWGQSTVSPASPGADESAGDTTLFYELDVARMLEVTQTLPTEVQDGIWRVTAGPEKRLLVLPLRITPTDAPSVYGPTAIRARGGRLLAYFVPAPQAADEAAPQDGDATANGPRIPRLTRSLTVTPQGHVQWKMDRAISGGTIANPAEPYGLKLQPAASEGNGDGPTENRAARAPQDRQERQDRQARQQEMENQRARAREQAEQRKRIASLATEFDEPLPPVVLAVVEIRTNTTTVDLSGAAPLPWRLSLEDLGALGRDLSDATLESVEQALTREPSAYGLRLAAQALVRSRLLDQPDIRPAAAALVRRVLGGSDAVARRVVIQVLASASTPAAAAVELLHQASSDAEGANRLTALGGLMRLAREDQAAVDRVLAGYDGLWTMPKAPPAERVIASLLERGLGGSEEVNAKLIDAVAWEKIPPVGREAAIKKVVERASDSSLARRWLNVKLLGATDPALARQTLTILAAAARAQDQPASGITFTRLDQALLGHLASKDSTARDLAWAGLMRFAVPVSALDDQPDSEPGPEVGLMVTIIQAATSTVPTPSTALAFVQAQTGRHARAAGLVRLALGADTATAAGAAKAMVGSGAPLGMAMAALEAADRRKLADRVYTALTGSVPLVTPLLLEAKGVHAVSDWWAGQVAGGQLPGAERWREAFNGTQPMLQIASSATDPAVKGAVAAALAAGAGGEAAAQQAMAKAFEQAKGARSPQLEEIWHARRHEILLRRIAAQARTYRFALVRAEPADRLELGLARLEVREGSPVLSVGNVSLAIPPDTQELVVRLTKPGELANFGVKGIEAWGLDQVSKIDLAPRADGTWVGEFTSPSGAAELRLDPQDVK